MRIRRRLLVAAGVTTCATMIVVAQPSLTPPAGSVTESGRFGLGTALSAANTPGDADSFYKITQPGMYYLSANLSVTNTGSAIEIASNDVVLDLNGFTVRAIGTLGPPVTDYGIFSESSNVVVRNGTVRAFDLAGVFATAGVANRAESIQAIDNGTVDLPINPGTGIHLGAGSDVLHCTAYDNANNGIDVGEGSSVAHCVAYANANAGIAVDAGSGIVECTASNNGNVGISAPDSLVAHCAALNNPVANIDIGATSSTLVGNHAP
jgi:hypothetical protein